MDEMATMRDRVNKLERELKNMRRATNLVLVLGAAAAITFACKGKAGRTADAAAEREIVLTSADGETRITPGAIVITNAAKASNLINADTMFIRGAEGKTTQIRPASMTVNNEASHIEVALSGVGPRLWMYAKGDGAPQIDLRVQDRVAEASLYGFSADGKHTSGKTARMKVDDRGARIEVEDPLLESRAELFIVPGEVGVLAATKTARKELRPGTK